LGQPADALQYEQYINIYLYALFEICEMILETTYFMKINEDNYDASVCLLNKGHNMPFAVHLGCWYLNMKPYISDKTSRRFCLSHINTIHVPETLRGGGDFVE
jgi:hypothetical protein